MRLAISLLLCLCWFSASAQKQTSFRLISKRENFPYLNTSCFLQGGDGVLWVGSKTSIVRYDGQEFLPITMGEEKAPIQTNQLLGSREGSIWAATGRGLVRLDPLSFAAERYPLEHPRAKGTDGLAVLSMGWAGKGRLLCSTLHGIFLFDTVSTSYAELPTKGDEPAKACPHPMQPDSLLHGLWVETWNRGLMFYDTIAGTLHQRGDERLPAPWVGEHLICLAPDGEGGYWASAHLRNAMHHIDVKTGSTRTWSKVPGSKDLQLSGAMFLRQDRSGTVWGSDWVYGSYWFNVKDSTAASLTSWNDEFGTIPGEYLYALHEAPTGELWFANSAGLLVHDPTQPQLRVFDPALGSGWTGSAPIFFDARIDGDSVVWCSSYNVGLFKYDLRSDRSTLCLKNSGGMWTGANAVRSVDGKVYVATDAELSTIERGTLKKAPVIMRDRNGKRLPSGGVSWMVPDDRGGLWLKSYLAFTHFDTRTGLAQRFEPDTADPKAMPRELFHAGACGPDGRFWVGGEEQGLAYYDPSSGSWTSLVADLREGRSSARRILDVAVAPDGMVWLGTDGNGLVRYDPRSGGYTQFDQRHGLAGLIVQTITFDDLGRLWLGTFEGFHCFDPATERALPVDLGSGMLFDQYSLGVSKGANGRLYIADRRRVLEVDPNFIMQGKVPPMPVVTRLSIDGKALASKNGLIEIPYGTQQLDIRYGAILPPGYVRGYAMRLNGQAWSESNEGVVSLRGLEPGTYEFELKVLNKEGMWSPVTKLRVHMDPPWWQTLVARIIFALLLAATIVLIFRARLNWVRKRERAQEEQARQLNELKLQALRAQMDPHFIFNCLNSIDSFIIASDREQASHYLGRFAKLIRLILQHSDSTRVPLEREVEMLKYYLELEALRFKHPFTFEVRVDEELEGEPVELPTMLVQPYIENAIWHGLRHKDSAGHIKVEFRLHADDLECVVEDNGVGRAASRAINQQRSGVHKSMGMRVSADRLRLYGELEQGASRVVVEDLRDDHGEASGTRVTIAIPLMDKEDEQ